MTSVNWFYEHHHDLPDVLKSENLTYRTMKFYWNCKWVRKKTSWLFPRVNNFSDEAAKRAKNINELMMELKVICGVTRTHFLLIFLLKIYLLTHKNNRHHFGGVCSKVRLKLIVWLHASVEKAKSWALQVVAIIIIINKRLRTFFCSWDFHDSTECAKRCQKVFILRKIINLILIIVRAKTVIIKQTWKMTSA